MGEGFVHRIRVGWADCDPARIAYTGKVVAFALEAIDAWWEATTGADWFRMNIDRDIGTPFVHLSVDFRSPVTPRHPLECEVLLIKFSGRSVRFSVRGFQDRQLCFEGRFVEALVRASDFGKVELSDDIAAKLRAAVSPAPPDLDDD